MIVVMVAGGLLLYLLSVAGIVAFLSYRERLQDRAALATEPDYEQFFYHRPWHPIDEASHELRHKPVLFWYCTPGLLVIMLIESAIGKVK